MCAQWAGHQKESLYMCICVCVYVCVGTFLFVVILDGCCVSLRREINKQGRIPKEKAATIQRGA